MQVILAWGLSAVCGVALIASLLVRTNRPPDLRLALTALAVQHLALAYALLAH